MANVASPYGLRPINLIGGQAFNGGVSREIKLSTNVATAFYTGDVIQLSSAGNPVSLAATPVIGTNYGVIGVCVGVRYTDPTLKYTIHAQTLPANAITAGYTDVFIKVCDDPDQLFMIQGSAAFGTLTNGASGAIGKNAALGNFGGSATTGLSSINLVVGVNGGSLGTGATLAMRIVDVPNLASSGGYPSSPTEAFPDIIVKFNHGAHSYYNATGATGT
jgi:hypothetical protein